MEAVRNLALVLYTAKNKNAIRHFDTKAILGVDEFEDSQQILQLLASIYWNCVTRRSSICMLFPGNESVNRGVNIDDFVCVN